VGSGTSDAGHAETNVSTPNEWNLLRHQFDALVHNESVDADSIEKTFDYQVRCRFVELINRAAEPSKQNRDWFPRIAKGHFVEI
jgi:hypothetical protein